MKTLTIPNGHKLPNHLFVGCNGDLHDTRKDNWSAKAPLREKWQFHFSRIETCAQLKSTLRAGEWAWPGAYPLYFITSDGAALSFESVAAELYAVLDSIKTNCNDGWRVAGCDVNYEDNELFCAHSNKRIESAYGE